MFKPIIIIRFTLCVLIVSYSCRGSKFNVSVTDLSSCKEYRLQSTYEYKHFFLIDNLRNVSQPGEIFHLKFYVMTTKDAHILLSGQDKPKKNDSVYEIVIGAGGNTFSTLRRKIGTTRLAFNSLPHILAPIDPTPIEVSQYTDGRLEVIIPGLSEPHLAYEDKTPLSVKYVSFSTFGNTPARWFYDCHSDGNQISDDKEALTELGKLERQLFGNKSYYPFSGKPRRMRVSFNIKGVKYNEPESIMKTRIELGLTWEDSTLQWHPEKFGNLTAISTSSLTTLRYTWTPNIIIKNGADYSYNDFNPTCSGIIFANGTIRIECIQKRIETWCLKQNRNWPFDILDCDIVLSIEGSNIKLIQENMTSMNNQQRISELSDWHLISIQSGLKRTEIHAYFSAITFVNELVIELKLIRSNLFYQKIFLSPLLVACLLILLSLCTSSYIRGGINLMCILITSITFLFLAKHAPLTYVPKIIHLYSAVMIVSCFSYFLHIQTELFRIFPPTLQPAKWLSNILNFRLIRIFSDYQFLQAPYYSGYQKHPWQNLCKIMNRACFVILTVTFFCLIM